MNFLKRQLEDPARFARIKRWFYISLVVIVVAEVLVLLAPIVFPNSIPSPPGQTNTGTDVDTEQKTTGQEDLDPAIITTVEEHHHFWFEKWIPAWGSLYGLASCVAIIVVSKFLGKVWLMRREDHYDA